MNQDCFTAKDAKSAKFKKALGALGVLGGEMKKTSLLTSSVFVLEEKHHAKAKNQ